MLGPPVAREHVADLGVYSYQLSTLRDEKRRGGREGGVTEREDGKRDG